MDKRFFSALAAMVLSIVLATGCNRSESVKAAPASAAPIARSTDPTADFPVPVVVFAGSPSSIGTEHATELSQPIHYLFEHYLKPYFSSETQRFLALGAASMFESRILPEYRDEIHALAAASHLDEREVMLAQCFLDLSPSTACSTITLSASASPDHIARFGRNLDFPGKGIADKQTVVMIYHPDGHYAFAAVSWPGLTGVLSGMNEHGLALANMELKRERRLPTAMPYILLYRTLLEQCKTVNDAIDLLQKTPRQSANNLMLMDAAGDRAVVEISPDSITVRRAPDSAALISTNHTRGPTDLDTPGLCKRYDALHNGAAQSFGHITVPALESLLASAGQGDKTLQSMIFEPATLTLYLSTGPHAHTGPFHKLDLNPYFASH